MRLRQRLIKAAARQSDKGYYIIANPTTGRAIGSCNKQGDFFTYDPYSNPLFVCRQLVCSVMNGTISNNSRAGRFGMLKSVRQLRSTKGLHNLTRKTSDQ